MSDHTMSTAASSPALSAERTSAAGSRLDFASDTELMLAAIARMEAAVRGERASHERLRADLGSMADAIAHIKTSLRNAQTTGKPVNVLVLLTWLEARVNGMRGYLGAPPAEPIVPEAVAGPAVSEAVQPKIAEAPAAEAVPTVSDVVSRLGRASDSLEQQAHALEQSAPADHDVPTVSMLGAMVEALTASEPVAAEAKAETPAQTEEPPVAEQVAAEPEAAVFEVAPEPVMTEVAAAETNIAEAAVAEAATSDVVTSEVTAAESQTVADAVVDDPAPEISAFSAELGTAEPAIPETAGAVEAIASETPVAEEVHIVEETVAAAVVVDEPSLGVVTYTAVSESDPIAEIGPSADASALAAESATVETAQAEISQTEVSQAETAETETAVAADATLAEPEAVAAEAHVEETADAALTEAALTEIAPTETISAEIAPTEIAAAETASTEIPAVAEPPTAASSAHEPSTRERSAHEFELLTRFAAMEAIPFMQDEIGTAVIFETKAEFDPAAEQMAFETPVKPVEAAAESVQAAAQPGAAAEAPQPETASLVQSEPESATVDVEPAASIATPAIEAHAEAVSQVQPETADAAQEPPAAAAPTKFSTYAAASSMTLGAIGATAAFAAETRPATKGVAQTAAPVEAVAAEAAAPEAVAEEATTKIEFFEIDEPDAKSEVAAAVPAVMVETAVVTEPAAVIAVVESAAPETAATIVAPEAKSEIAKSEIADRAQAQAETAAGEIAEPVANAETTSTETEVAIAGPSETERAAFAQALAEMAVAAALEPEIASAPATETRTEAAPAAPIETETLAVAATTPAEASDAEDDDLSDLFEPEPDAALDPNNILLGPAPVSTPTPAFTLDPATAAVLPMHDLALPEAPKGVSMPAAPQLKLVEMTRPEAAKPPAPANIPARLHDPLAPLKAMSDEEKIALFS